MVNGFHLLYGIAVMQDIQNRVITCSLDVSRPRQLSGGSISAACAARNAMRQWIKPTSSEKTCSFLALRGLSTAPFGD